MQHRYNNDCEDHCGQCNECVLDTCIVCLASEGELTKDCPGKVVEGWMRELVLKGKLDFTAEKGWWSKEFNLPVKELELKNGREVQR